MEGGGRVVDVHTVASHARKKCKRERPREDRQPRPARDMARQRAACDHARKRHDRRTRTGRRARALTNEQPDSHRDYDKADPLEEKADAADEVVRNRVVAENPHTENDEPDEDDPSAAPHRPGKYGEGCRYQDERKKLGDPVPVVN
ncbi:MAG: hypothetical protein LC749_17560, partial [Actinobacteria bacterium]|nr:hypothetical protein [Actinomycetota bacterium]